MNDRADALLEIGKVTGTHGLRGDLRVRPNSGDPAVLMEAEHFYIDLPAGERLTVQPLRQSLHKGQVLLRLQGYESINLVESFVGGAVLVSESLLPELPDDEYYWSQIKGLAVVDRRRGQLGHLEQMFTTAAHDTYVVQGDMGEIMIPVVEQFVLDIDLQERLIRVDLPDGLIPEE